MKHNFGCEYADFIEPIFNSHIQSLLHTNWKNNPEHVRQTFESLKSDVNSIAPKLKTNKFHRKQYLFHPNA